MKQYGVWNFLQNNAVSKGEWMEAQLKKTGCELRAGFKNIR